jgi:CheY-like chemotaxis protein
MSEAISFPSAAEANAAVKRTPTVYFIDDSATMREVIKIAFRRENITVITAGDAVSAMAQFEQHPPDAVITDVIMPDQDGYSVCSQIKQHERFGRTPVILMSGVVNKNVADKAVSVGADELIRKPFQPVDLIARVKSFLEPRSPAQPAVPALATPRVSVPSPLSSLFAQPVAKAPLPAAPVPTVAVAYPSRESSRPAAVGPTVQPGASAAPNYLSQTQSQPPVRPAASMGDIQKLKTEISRLELLIKKLQTELQIERQYNQALELHVKSLTSLE